MFAEGDIIVAPATATGGALTVIRVSGAGSVEIVARIFRGVREADITTAVGYTLHYGYIVDGEDVVDDVVLSLFRAPHSYTGEDGVEISCHGSSYITAKIIELVIDNGARMASAGEFTVRAFMAGRMDLSQAEAVGDIIAATNRATHRLASTQMRGGYSSKLTTLRDELVHIGALLALELDFSEEDVEFANRAELSRLVDNLLSETTALCESFRLGNALKEGVRVAIVGAPNAGKSTLLNRLLGEERAMVSDIAGTTRDTIEDVAVIEGVKYRFIDTAGVHETTDMLERMGIERTMGAMAGADVVLHMVDASAEHTDNEIVVCAEQHYLRLYNKSDLSDLKMDDGLNISAKSGAGVDDLKDWLSELYNMDGVERGDTIVSNSRHYEHLSRARGHLERTQSSLADGVTSDLLNEDIRQVLTELGSITGEITTNDLLQKVFSSFCIGK